MQNSKTQGDPGSGNRQRLPRIGVTGNSGAGKSVVARILEDLGAFVVDADKISRQITEKDSPAYHEIVQTFGTGILDSEGHIDRKKLGAVVFADHASKKELERISHRYILEEMNRQIEELQNNPGDSQMIVLDAPLLIEAGLHTQVDQVWIVVADQDTRLARVTQRDGLTREQALARFAVQTPFEELKKYGDAVLFNNGKPEDLRKQILHILNVE